MAEVSEINVKLLSTHICTSQTLSMLLGILDIQGEDSHIVFPCKQNQGSNLSPRKATNRDN